MPIESQYNYRFRGSDGASVILNGLSGTVIADPGDDLASEAFSDVTRAFLREHHFVVDSRRDEVELLLMRNRDDNQRQDRMELTLMLHEDCNFRCTYCFEDFTNRKLENPTLSSILALVDRTLPRGGELYVHYYGGEPLLAWTSLVAVTEQLEAVCAARTATFRFYITTNGSLLSKARLAYLADHHVAHVKITLDGPPAIHNHRRVKGNGGGTFDGILTNVIEAVRRIRVILRVNVDAGNIDHVPELLDILERECGDHAGNLLLDYNPVYDRETGRLREGLSYDRIQHLQTLTLDRGFRLKLPPLRRTRYCKFNSRNSLLIDTTGAMYLCSKGDDFRVGHLGGAEAPAGSATPGASAAPGAVATGRRLPVVQASTEVERRFQNPKEQCPECNLLPICGGGCTLLSYSTQGPPCPPWKESVDDYLRLHWRVMQENLEAET